MLCALAPLRAVETKTWEQSAMADYEKAVIKGLSLSSDGHLALAPAVKELADPSVTFLWAVARDSKGNIYAGGGGLGGSKARLIVIDPQGRSKTLAELDGLAVQALAVDRQDRLYAATAPDGKVYRVDASGKAEVFYDPKAKYIWALAFAPNGDLFVATGDAGEIYRITPAGAGSVFFRTGESHVRSLAVDATGNLIAGTDPGGLVLRISRAAGGNTGEGFVLYQSPKREVTAVAVSPSGDIYAAATGTRQAVAPAPAPPPLPAAQQAQAAAQTGTVVTVRPAQPAPLTIAPAPPVTGGSELYRIQADGYPRKIWSHAQDLIYALAFDPQGRVLAGTGNHGALYRIDNEHLYTRLLSVDPTQITGLLAAPGGTLYAVSGNIGKVFAIGPGMVASGTLESDVLDAAAFSYWGRISHEPEGDAGLVFETRSGNLNRTENNWSPWAKLNGGRIASPAARFLQYRVTLSGVVQLSDVSVAYQMKNVAPVIEELEITPVNYRFPAPAANAAAANPPITLAPLGRKPASSSAGSGESASSPTLNWAKGVIGARWLSADENGDTLTYTVEIRGKNETSWKLVRDKVKERYLSWDSSAFPDGEYVVRLTASDAPSNPPGEALTASRETETFLIDNTPPEITGLVVTPNGAKLQVRFHVKDALSVLGKAELSVNGGDWMVVEPTTRLTDSTEHDYRVEIDKPSGEATIAVRAEDSYENQGVAKVVVR
jgi:hypothetical protein